MRPKTLTVLKHSKFSDSWRSCIYPREWQFGVPTLVCCLLGTLEGVAFTIPLPQVLCHAIFILFIRGSLVPSALTSYAQGFPWFHGVRPQLAGDVGFKLGFRQHFCWLFLLLVPAPLLPRFSLYLPSVTVPVGKVSGYPHLEDCRIGTLAGFLFRA